MSTETLELKTARKRRSRGQELGYFCNLKSCRQSVDERKTWLLSPKDGEIISITGLSNIRQNASKFEAGSYFIFRGYSIPETSYYCKVGINQPHVSRSRSIIRQLLSVSVFPCTTGSPLRHIGLGNGTYLTPEGPYQERLRQKIGNWGYPWLGLLHSGQGKGLQSFFQCTICVSLRLWI